MKLKLDRIISIATLFAALLAIVLVLKRPTPVVVQAPAATAAPAQSSGQPMDQREQAQREQAAQQAPSAPASVSGSSGNYQATPSGNQQTTSSGSQSSSQPKVEVHIKSDEIGAALAQALGAAGSGQLSPDSNLGSGAPTIKDQQVSFEGDVVHGQFLTEVAGKDVWVTVSGHLASKDGYATFEPTEFKVGDLNVPISLVNPALQKKLAEQHDRLKLPEFVGDVKVQNGELVMQQK